MSEQLFTHSTRTHITMTSHAISLGQMAANTPIKRRKPAIKKPTERISQTNYKPVLFSLVAKADITEHEVYTAAIAAMNEYSYEPPEFACLRVRVRYFRTKPARKALKSWACLKPGLQKALGDDVTISLLWAGGLDGDVIGGAVVEVTEVV